MKTPYAQDSDSRTAAQASNVRSALGPADYILETFPIVKRKDIARHGEYRTRRVILEMYDAMAEAMAGGPPYQTRLDPPPADPRVAHPMRDTM